MNDKLPIVKTISYSSLVNWQLCPHYYKLVDILRLKPWQNTPDTIFGTLIHKYCQDDLEGKVQTDEACKDFERKWKKFCGIYKLNDFLPYTQSGVNIIKNCKIEFKKQFGNFKIIKIEKRIALPSGDKWPQQFRGFVDLIIELEDGTIVIVDLKTSDSAYFFNKFRDKYKDYQLVLYKHFHCLEEKLDLKKIETYFVVLEKNSSSKKPIGFIRVTSGPKKLQNALKWLDAGLSAINRQIFIRNRSSCFKYGENNRCVFYDTEHCPKR